MCSSAVLVTHLWTADAMSIFFIPAASAKDLMVFLLRKGIAAMCDRSTSTFLRPLFLGFRELISTGIPFAWHCFTCRQIRHTTWRLTLNNSATIFVAFLLSFPRLLLTSNASYICCLWVALRSFDRVLAPPFACSFSSSGESSNSSCSNKMSTSPSCVSYSCNSCSGASKQPSLPTNQGRKLAVVYTGTLKKLWRTMSNMYCCSDNSLPKLFACASLIW